MNTRPRTLEDLLISQICSQEEIMTITPNSSTTLTLRRKKTCFPRPWAPSLRLAIIQPVELILCIILEHIARDQLGLWAKEIWILLAEISRLARAPQQKNWWDKHFKISMLNQSSWRAKLVNSNNSLAYLTVSRKCSPKTSTMKRWSFQSLDLQVTEEEIDVKISSEKASVNLLFRVKSFREI